MFFFFFVHLGESTSEILQVAIKARARALGPFHPSFDVNKIIYDGLVKTLPDDAHIRANGRLFISVTRIQDGKNVIIDQFKSKEELIKVCSVCVCVHIDNISHWFALVSDCRVGVCPKPLLYNKLFAVVP